MTKKSTSAVDFIRIIPRDSDFLDRRTGSRGEIFYEQASNTLKLYDGSIRGGIELSKSDLANVSIETIRSKTIESGLATVIYNVTISSPQSPDIGNKYNLNGVYRPQINFVIGYTYVFVQDDLTNVYFPNANGTTPNPHPLNFSADNLSGVTGGGTSYLQNVKYFLDSKEVTQSVYNSIAFNNASSRQVRITVTSSTPSILYYWCWNHLAMGNSVSVAAPGAGSSSVSTGATTVTVSESLPNDPANGNLWLNTENGILYVYVDDGDSEQWIQPSSPLNLNNLTLDNTTLTNVNSMAFQSGVTILRFSADGTFAENSNSIVPVESAIKTYVDTTIGLEVSSEVSQAIANVVGNAPSDLNTLGEIASAIDNDASFYTTINSALATKSPINNPSFTGITTLSSTSEIITPLLNSSSTVDHNFSSTSVFYHESIADDFTANFTNVPTTNNRTFSVALILEQGPTAYIPTAVEINGDSQTINWQGAELPSGTPNNIDIVSFTFIRKSDSWAVIGSISTYG